MNRDAGLPEGGGRSVGIAPAGQFTERGTGGLVVGPQVVDPCQAPRGVVAETAEAMLLGEEEPVGAERRVPLPHGFVDAADDIDREASFEVSRMPFPELPQSCQGAGVVVPVPLDGGDAGERGAGAVASWVVPDVAAEDLLLLVPQPHLPVHLGQPFQRQSPEPGFLQDPPVEGGGRGIVPLPSELPGFTQHGVAAAKSETLRVFPAKLAHPFPGAAAPIGAGRPPARFLMDGVGLAVFAPRLVGLAEVVGGARPGRLSRLLLLEGGCAADGRLVALPRQIRLDQRERRFLRPDALGVRFPQSLEVVSRGVVSSCPQGDPPEIVEGVVSQDQRGVGQGAPEKPFGAGVVALGVVTVGPRELRLGHRQSVRRSRRQADQKDPDTTGKLVHDCMGTRVALECNRRRAAG